MFNLSNFIVHNGATVAGNDPLAINGPAGRWDYVVSFANEATIAEARAFGSAKVEIELNLTMGELEVCAVKHDWCSMAATSPIAASGKAAIYVDNMADIAALLIRNRDTDIASSFSVVSIGLFKSIHRPKPPERGFARKSLIEDIKGIFGERYALTIFDVGANIGNTVREYSEAFPGASIHAFEPHPQVCSDASAKYSSDAITFHNLALGSAKGSIALNCYSQNAINSINKVADGAPMDGDTRFIETISVPMTTIDSFASEFRVRNVDLLKIDTQGYESEVIAGARDMLSEQRVEAILVELNFVKLYEDQSSPFRVSAALEAFGYKLFDFYSFVYAPSGRLKWGDALFVSSALRD